MINLEIKENFILQTLIKDVQLFKSIEFSLQMHIVNKYIVILYNTQKLSITLIDNLKFHKNDRCQFYAINIRNYDIILKFS